MKKCKKHVFLMLEVKKDENIKKKTLHFPLQDKIIDKVIRTHDLPISMPRLSHCAIGTVNIAAIKT